MRVPLWRVTGAGITLLSLLAGGLAGCSRGSSGVSAPTEAAPVRNVAVTDTDWRVWRGPTGDGISPDRAAIVSWSAEQNRLWSADVPGRGHASPVVAGDQVFVATADESQGQQLLLSYDRKSGQERWRAVVHQGTLPRMHGKNSQASATPACDQNRVYVLFIHADGLYATAYDFAGQQVWQTKVGSFQSEHGYGSSPALFEGSLFVNGDSLKDCFVAAVDCETGSVRWKTDRTTTGKHGSYATPIVAQVAGKPQLLLSGMRSTDSYDPATGSLLWTVRGPAEVTACTPAFHNDLVFSSGGYPEKELLAIRADGTGDVTASHIAWRSTRGVTYVPSPLYHNGRLYVVSDDGIASCFDATSGKQIWQERLSGKFSASPVLAGEYLYVPSEDGKTFVLRASDKFAVVAVNDLGDGGFATPVICGGRVYLRTNHRLYCFGNAGEPTGT